MPCPHYKVNIISRGRNQSAVAAAAYQSGEKLYSDRDHRTKHYGSKEGIVYTEILLPAHAPPEFSDRNILWNSVEAVEPNWNSQLARRFVITLPKELSIEQNIQLIREHCKKEFVSRGMIADIGVHDPDPPGHNPHAHVMLTMRPLDEQGQWMEKSHKEYDLDEERNRIRDGNGKWKTHKVFTTDWDNRGNVEMWRHGWEEIQNRYLENAGRSERVSMKSYERQGIDRVPEVHMGPAVSAMERRGIKTDIGNLNRDIKHTNQLIANLRQMIKKLVSWIAEIKDAITEIELQPNEIYLTDLLIQKFDQREHDRAMHWGNRAGMKKAGIKDFQRFSEITAYMHEKNILTVEHLGSHMQDIQDMVFIMRSRMKQIKKRMKTIETIMSTAERYRELKPVHDQYMKIHWKGRQQQFEKQHKSELDEWNRCSRYLHKNLPEFIYRPKALSEEKESLQTELDNLTTQLSPLQNEIDMMKDIRWLIKDLLPELEPEKEGLTSERRAEKKESILDQLTRYREAAEADNERRRIQDDRVASRPNKDIENIERD